MLGALLIFRLGQVPTLDHLRLAVCYGDKSKPFGSDETVRKDPIQLVVYLDFQKQITLVLHH